MSPDIRSVDGKVTVNLINGQPVFLLGVGWGHHEWKEDVRDPVRGRPMPDGHYVNTNSGMVLVVPAWKLLEMLTSDHAIAERLAAEERDIANSRNVAIGTRALEAQRDDAGTTGDE